MSVVINVDLSIVIREIAKFIDSSNINMWWEHVGDKIVSKASLPAAKVEDIGIDINDKELTLTRELNIADGGTILERICKISRTFDLPDGVKRSNFKSTSMEDGILTVTFTKDAAVTNTSSRSICKKVIAFLNAEIHWETSQDKHVLKVFPLPGMKKEDVKIEIEDDGKELKMIIQLETEEEEEGDTILEWLREEFRDGKIIRRLKLPTDVRLDDFEAEMEEDGVLTVTFNKPIKPKKTRQLISKLLRFLAKAAAAPFTKLNQKSKLLRVLSTKKLISKLGVLAKAAPVCILCSNSGSSNNSNSQR